MKMLAIVLLVAFSPLSALASAAPVDDRDPDIAFDSTAGVHLSIWRRVDSLGMGDVVGQLLDSSGNPFGAEIALETDAALDASAPRVTANAMRSRFFVVWQEDDGVTTSVVGRSVDAMSGALSSRIILTNDGETPDVGSDGTGLRDQAVVVWYRNYRVYDREVILPAVGDPILHGVQRELFSYATGPPRISPCAGEAGRHVVVWRASEPFGCNNLLLRAIDAHGVPVSARVYPKATCWHNPSDYDVDGDGTDWFVALTNDAGAGCELLCLPVHFDPAAQKRLVLGPTTLVAGGTGLDAGHPSIARMNGSYALGYSLDGIARVQSFDALSCAPCETEVIIDTGGDDVIAMSVASNPVADPSSASLFAYGVRDSRTGSDEVRYVPLVPEDGVFVPLGGDCGQGGVIASSCARVGNASFALRVADAAPNAPAFLVVSAFDALETCGACTIHPDPSLPLAVHITGTNGKGRAVIPLPIPDDPTLAGTVVYAQFALLSAAPVCSTYRVDLSAGLEIWVQ